jgi:hypothetical protein
MSDPVTQRKLRGFLRDAYWGDLTAKDATDAGIAEEDVPRVLAFAKKIRELYAGGSHAEALYKMDEAVGALGDVTFCETTDALNPRRLAARAVGDVAPDEGDENDPRALARNIQIY